MLFATSGDTYPSPLETIALTVFPFLKFCILPPILNFDDLIGIGGAGIGGGGERN